MTRVEVTIGQVVVHGLAGPQARAAVHALDTHLADLLADPATRWPGRDTSVAALRPARIRSGRATDLGGAAAQAVHAAVQGR